MRSDREERIKQRAYALWQSEGHGHGRHEDHWHRAEREIAAEEAGPRKAPRRASRSRTAAAGKSTENIHSKPQTGGQELESRSVEDCHSGASRSGEPGIHIPEPGVHGFRTQPFRAIPE
jgi:hypothetical protein